MNFQMFFQVIFALEGLTANGAIDLRYLEKKDTEISETIKKIR